MDNNGMIKAFFKQINDLINHKLSGLTRISSATIQNRNTDGTYDIILPYSSTVYTGI
jgi:hypothetical protein